MRRILFICVVLSLVFALPAFGKKPPVDESNWPSIEGEYTGQALVQNEEGQTLQTPVRLQIRKGKKNSYIVEMVYFRDKIAKFTKCKRLGKWQIAIHEKVENAEQKINISGKLTTKDGKLWQGRIRYRVHKDNSAPQNLRVFKLENLKKVK